MLPPLFLTFCRSFGGRLLLGLLACGALLALDMSGRQPMPPSAKGDWSTTASPLPNSRLVVQAQGQIPMPANTPAAHASTLLALPPDHPSTVMAFWFAGSRESGPDVQIAAAAFDRASQQWSPARYVVSRNPEQLKLGFGLRRLGNPVAWRDAQGRIHLFVVATGLGGWAAGRILHLRQEGEGWDFSKLEFRPQRVLPLSWLWNTSHLVRAMPLPLADGGMVLPAYFELGIKYPVALRFNAEGGFLGMVRISARTHLLQPTLLMRSESDWLALMRDGGEDKKIKVAQTLNGGRDWRDLPDLPLANPDAAIAGLSLAPGLQLLAHNTRPDSRAVLDLSTSADGLLWTRQLTLAQGGDGAAGAEYSYPSLAWADDSLWVSYTDHRRAIAWQRLALTPAQR